MICIISFAFAWRLSAPPSPAVESAAIGVTAFAAPRVIIYSSHWPRRAESSPLIELNRPEEGSGRGDGATAPQLPAHET